jgi:MoxR-like ATPase
VKLQNLIAASALICKRKEAILSDLWVLKYIWDTEEQIEILAGIINNVIEKDASEKSHPQALYKKVPNAEEVMKEVEYLTGKWNDPSLSFEEQNVIKDKLRYVQTRCSWITNAEQKQHIQAEIESLWQKILQAV